MSAPSGHEWKFNVAAGAGAFVLLAAGLFSGLAIGNQSAKVVRVKVPAPATQVKIASLTKDQLLANLGDPPQQTQNGLTCAQKISGAGGQHLIAVCWQAP